VNNVLVQSGVKVCTELFGIAGRIRLGCSNANSGTSQTLYFSTWFRENDEIKSRKASLSAFYFWSLP
jgi:hypothetical protein